MSKRKRLSQANSANIVKAKDATVAELARDVHELTEQVVDKIMACGDTVQASGTSDGAKKGWEGREHGGVLKLTDGRLLEIRRTEKDPENMFKFRTGNADEIADHSAEHAAKSSGHNFLIQNLAARGYKVHSKDHAKLQEFFEGSKSPTESSWDKHYREASAKASSVDNPGDTVKAGTAEGVRKEWETRHAGGGEVDYGKFEVRKGTHPTNPTALMFHVVNVDTDEVVHKTENREEVKAKAKEHAEKQPAKSSGMSVEEGKAYLAERAKHGAFGLSWDQIEKGQGGKLKRASDQTMDTEQNIVSCRAANGVQLTETWAAGAPVSFVYAPEGLHTITAGFRKNDTITISVIVDAATAPVLQESFDHLTATMPKQEPYGDEDHESKKATIRFPVGATTFSWGKIKEDVGIIIKGGAPTSYGANAVNGKDYRSWSPEFGTDADMDKAAFNEKEKHWTFPDGVRGSESNPARLTGVNFVVGALTNRPAFRAMPPVKARLAEVEKDTVQATWSDAARQASAEARKHDDQWIHRSESAHKLSWKAAITNKSDDHTEAGAAHFEMKKEHERHADRKRKDGDEFGAKEHERIAKWHNDELDKHIRLAEKAKANPDWAKGSSPDKFHNIGNGARDVLASLADHRDKVDAIISAAMPKAPERGPAKCALDVLDDLKAAEASKGKTVKAMWSDAARQASIEARKRSPSAVYQGQREQAGKSSDWAHALSERAEKSPKDGARHAHTIASLAHKSAAHEHRFASNQAHAEHSAGAHVSSAEHHDYMSKEHANLAEKY